MSIAEIYCVDFGWCTCTILLSCFVRVLSPADALVFDSILCKWKVLINDILDLFTHLFSVFVFNHVYCLKQCPKFESNSFSAFANNCFCFKNFYLHVITFMLLFFWWNVKLRISWKMWAFMEMHGYKAFQRMGWVL